MNSLCTKQPLNKGHLCIKAKTLFPKGVRYRGAPLYITEGVSTYTAGEGKRHVLKLDTNEVTITTDRVHFVSF